MLFFHVWTIEWYGARLGEWDAKLDPWIWIGMSASAPVP